MIFRSVQSISARLTLLVLFVSGTALMLAYISFLAYDYYSLRQNLIESLESQANMIGANSETALLFDDAQVAEARPPSSLQRSSEPTDGLSQVMRGEALRDKDRRSFPISQNSRPARTRHTGFRMEQSSLDM